MLQRQPQSRDTASLADHPEQNRQPVELRHHNTSQPLLYNFSLWEDKLISQQEVQHIADGLRYWLHRRPWVSQGFFAIHYLNRSQGTISHLLRWATAPTSRQGEEVWLRIKAFLDDKELQDEISMKAKKHKGIEMFSHTILIWI